MRLLSTTPSAGGDFIVQEFLDGSVPRYAILSHTWGAEEVTLQDMQSGRATQRQGFAKISGCCALAKVNGFAYVWVDTCCIDKTSSAELSEAINSMYRWYQEADICYAYLADVGPAALSGQQQQQQSPPLASMKHSRWFTRGWTLQELIAPTHLVFLDGAWTDLGTRTELAAELAHWTGIPAEVLTGAQDVDAVSVAQRMAWASGRQTARIEDQAYCLMGLFDINMPLIYGEGSKAFLRLQEEIIRVSGDHSIFAWRADRGSLDHHHQQGLLATSPHAFKDSAGIVVHGSSPAVASSTPLVVSSKGIHLEVPFLAVGHDGLGLAILHCAMASSLSRPIGIYVRDTSFIFENFERVWCDKFESVNLEVLRPPQYPFTKMCIQQPRRMRRQRQQRDVQAAGTAALTSDRKLRMFRNEADVFVNDGEGQQGRKQAKQTTLPKLDTEAREYLMRHANFADAEQMKHLLFFSDMQFEKFTDDGRSHLSHAAEHGHTDIAWVLLMRPTTKPNSQGSQGRTPLTYAARRGHLEVAWLLLARGDVRVHVKDHWGLTPLSYAAMNGHTAIVDMILSRDPAVDHILDNRRRSALSYASEQGHVDIVRSLLANGSVVASTCLDTRDVNYLTCLGHATMNGHHAVMRLLLEQGADAEKRIGGFDFDGDANGDVTVLWLAVMSGESDSVELLLRHGVDTEVVPDNQEGTPLVWAVREGRYGIAQLLASHDAAISELEVCPLQSSGAFILWAVKTGDHTLARRLLSHFARRLHTTPHEGMINVQDDEGNTALHWAVRVGNRKLVQYILIYRPDIQRRNARGQTPLHCAVVNSDLETVTMLVKAKAGAHIKDNDGETPLSLALASERHDIHQLLPSGDGGS